MRATSLRPGRIALWMFSIVVALYLVLPLFIILPVSFTSSAYLSFPPPGYSLRWYKSVFADAAWVDAMLLSLKVGVTVVCTAVPIGFLAALAFSRYRVPVPLAVRTVLLTPMVVPLVIAAVAIYGLFAKLQLIGSFWGVVLAHTILAIPFAFLLISAGFEKLDRSLDEASYSMGASYWYTMRHVTIPLLAPSMFSAAVFAFITSWDEVVIMIFIGSTKAETLPLKMYSYMTTEIHPAIAAVSMLLVVVVALPIVLRELMRSDPARSASSH